MAGSVDLRGKKERNGIERRVDSNSNEHVHIYLPICKSIFGKLDVEMICQGATVMFEATFDFSALLL